MRNHNLLAVNEVYGPCHQGEGRESGMPIVVLRLAGCNLACVWCDSRYAWNWGEYDPKVEIMSLTVEQVAAQVIALGNNHVRNLMVTGGEPLLQSTVLPQLFKLLPDWNFYIETAGTFPPLVLEPIEQARTWYTVSPKLQNSGNESKDRRVPWALRQLRELQETQHVAWKFVAHAPADFPEISNLVNEFDLTPVYVMPEGYDRETILQRSPDIAQACLQYGYGFTTRLQVLLYGNRRGV
jgi:organic radical activating enzyme